MLSSRYYLASIVLLILVVGAYAVSAARRTQAELAQQLEQKSLALAGAVESASRQAIRSNALVEEMVAQRLFDNARLVDELHHVRPLDADALARIAERNGLRRIDLLDPDGRPWTPPPAPRPQRVPGMGLEGMMHGRHSMGMMRRFAPDAGGPGPEPGPPQDRGRPRDREPGERPMMHYMWGRRWTRPPSPQPDAPPAPPAIEDRKFWEGTLLGVGIGARSFPGIIAVHADAGFVLNFRKEMGVDRQIADLAREAGTSAVALLDADGAVLAHSDPERAGGRADDQELRAASTERRTLSRFVEVDNERRFQIARPLALDGGTTGMLVVDFSATPMERAWAGDVRQGAAFGGAVLLVGALGYAAIFAAQRRHLREVSRLEGEMARSQRLSALGDVAAAFAHEVRNPLNAVSMGLERLRTEFAPEPPGDYARFVELLEGEVRRLNAIVEQFITLARPVPLTRASFSPDALLHELATLLQSQAKPANVAVRVGSRDGGRAIFADRDRLEQVLLNLSLNALQAMPDGGTLTLESAVERHRAVLSVTDTGRGIAADDLPRVFDPYFTTRGDGLGLGLTIARRIVEAHGGSMDVASTPGEGTRFTIVLPSGSA
jgi:signal transduction histidine kinase